MDTYTNICIYRGRYKNNKCTNKCLNKFCDKHIKYNSIELFDI